MDPVPDRYMTDLHPQLVEELSHLAGTEAFGIEEESESDHTSFGAFPLDDPLLLEPTTHLFQRFLAAAISSHLAP